MGYLIFIPEKLSITDAELTELGIADLVEGLSPVPEFLGPSGATGMVYSVGGELKLDKSGLKWIPAHGMHFAYDPDNPPMPADLLREGAKGTVVPLLDGHEWLVRDMRCRGELLFQELINDIYGFTKRPGWHCGFAGQVYIPGSMFIVRRSLRENYRLPDELMGVKGLNLFDLPTLSVAVLHAVGIYNEIRRFQKLESN